MSEQTQELRVSFDPQSGRLRLTPDLLVEAVDAFTEGAGFPSGLVDAGAVPDGILAEPLPVALKAVTAPEAQLQVRVAGPGGAVLHQGWLHQDGSAVMLQVNDELGDLITLPAEFIPSTLYHAVNLGPVPRLKSGRITASADVLGSLLDPDPDVRDGAIKTLVSHAPAEWQEWTEGFAEASWCAWTARMVWLGEDGEPKGQSVAVVANLNGMLIMTRTEDGQMVFVPTTATEVWSMLVLLLAID